jgi:hypothetical protein
MSAGSAQLTTLVDEGVQYVHAFDQSVDTRLANRADLQKVINLTTNSPLRRISIRDVRGATIAEAAANQEVLGITNQRQLVAVLLPLSQEWVDQLISDSMSRIVTSIQSGGLDALTEGGLTPLDSILADTPRESSRLPLRRVAIRELSGPLFDEIAEDRRPIAVMNDGQLCGVVVPISQGWVDQLIDHSISRLAHSMDLARKEASEDLPVGSLDELRQGSLARA